MRILVVKAHPHDFTHCAGTLGTHVQRGDVVTVVSMTNGASTHNEALHEELIKPVGERDAARMQQLTTDYAATKDAEFRQACSLFGIIDVRILGFRDKQFRKSDEAVNAVRRSAYGFRRGVE